MVGFASVADGAAEVGHEAIDVIGVSLHEIAADAWGQAEEGAADEIGEAGGFFELIASAAAEDSLRDAFVDELWVVVHHPVDEDFVASAVEGIGESHIADDGAFEGAAGEGEESEDWGWHRE